MPSPAEPRKTILYEPQSPSGRVEISYSGDGFVLHLGSHDVALTDGPNTLAVLRTILRAQASAAKYAATPRLGSECYPTQHDVNVWLKLREATKSVLIAAVPRVSMDHDPSIDLGF